MSGKEIHEPVHRSAGVGGMLMMIGVVAQRRPPAGPRLNRSEVVHGTLSVKELELGGWQMFASQRRDSWCRPAVTTRETRR